MWVTALLDDVAFTYLNAPSCMYIEGSVFFWKYFFERARFGTKLSTSIRQSCPDTFKVWAFSEHCSSQSLQWTTGGQHNMNTTLRYNAAAHGHQQAKRCIYDTPICALLIFLVTVCCVCRSLRSVFKRLPYCAAVVCRRCTLTQDIHVMIRQHVKTT